MPIKFYRSLMAPALVALSTLNPQLSTAHAQGSLMPPGPPAPTMITLSQIEPRTPIPGAPFYIVQPGSYYLTTNLTVADGDAIDINTNGVTLDLNGFTISSTGTYGTAIMLNIYNPFTSVGNSDITILNGHITGGVTNKAGVYGGPGFYNGISFFQAPPMPPYNVRVTGVSVSGCQYNGIYLGTGNSTVVESCTVKTVGGYGIEASSVSHSTAYQCGNTAISADTASDCYAYSTGGDGLDVNQTANNCYGNSDGNGNGLDAGTANNCSGTSAGSGEGLNVLVANNCIGVSGSGAGIYAIDIATGCTGQSSSGDGLDVGVTANNCQGTCTSGPGLTASIATGCWGASNSSSTGLSASQIAIGCYGSSSGGTGLSAPIANSCAGSGSPPYSVAHPYNMP